jgi:glutamate-1-semialdehyde 2,1-aminomutase
LVLEEASGAEVIDVDGRRYVDFVLGMGPILLGHGRAEVLSAVHDQLGRGVLFGTHAEEIRLAERLVDLLPYADKVVYANSGSEATHWAIRIARATTGRRVVVKFEGHYHGWIDPLFANTQGVRPAPESLAHPQPMHAAGMVAPQDVAICRWNDLDELRAVFDENSGEVAAVIMEPIPMNFGTMLPDDGYLEGVRALCESRGALLIFDEVLAGFRVALGGASEVLGVQPHLGVYAKAIASGFPLAVVAGTEASMASITDGDLLPAGTYSAGPAAVAAAHATLDVLTANNPEIYQHLERLGNRLRHRLLLRAREHDLPLVVQQIGSVVQLLWDVHEPVRTFADAMTGDRDVVRRACEAVQRNGFYLSPRGLILISTEHTAAMVDGLADALIAALLADGCAKSEAARV